jgi:hypothetical protein
LKHHELPMAQLLVVQVLDLELVQVLVLVAQEG